jgi:cell division protein FtsQ
LEFKKIVDLSKFEFQEIKNLYYFESGRWDIELDNNILIKLPSQKVDQSLKLVFDFINNDNLAGIKVVDARIKNQIILND